MCACSFEHGALDGSGSATDAGRDGALDDARMIDTRVAAACTQAWTLTYGASRYFIGANKNYDDSQIACVAQGARLAIIETAGEDAALASMLAMQGADSWTWIGLSDRTTEGVDIWIDGVTVGATDYKNYSPKIGDTADCYDFSRDPNGGKWGDYYCTYVHSYLCECDPARPFPP